MSSEKGKSVKKVFLIFYILLSLFLFSRELAPAPDFLAADEIAAKYRKLDIDPVVLSVPENIKNGLNSDPEKYLVSLTEYLIKGSDDDYLKIKRIHDWITDNISYDTDLFCGIGKGSRNTYDIVKLKRTTCGGFSALLKEMATIAGIECITVSGISRNYITSKNEASGHAWNAVRIDNKWYIVDSTADGRNGYKNGTFGKKGKYSSQYLFIKPEAKLLDNFPNDPALAFTEVNITKEEYINNPIYHINTFLYPEVEFLNIKDIYQKYYVPMEGDNQIRVYDMVKADNNIVTFKLKCPKNVVITTTLTDDNDNKYPFNHFSYIDNGGITYCKFSAPKTGVFTGAIRAIYLDHEDTTHTLYTFKVVSDKGSGEELPEINSFVYNSRFEYFNLELIENNFVSAVKDGYYFFKLKAPKDVSIYSSLKDKNYGNIKDSVVIDIGDDFKSYYYKIPQSLNNEIYFYVKYLDDSEKSHQYCAKIRLPKAEKISEIPPALKIIRYNSFSEKGLEIVENIVKNDNNTYSIKIKSPSDEILTSVLKDSDGARYDNNFIYDYRDSLYAFTYTAPQKKGRYTATISVKNSEGKYNGTAYFIIESAGAQSGLLPLSGALYKQRDAEVYNIEILDNNFNSAENDGYYRFELPVIDDVEYYTGLYNKEGKTFNEHVSYSFENNRKVYFVTPPDKDFYHVKVSFKNPSKDKNYNKIIYRFGINNMKPKFSGKAPPYQIFYKKEFYNYDMKIISEDIASLKKNGGALIKIECGDEISITSNIKDSDKKNKKGYYKKEYKDGVYYLTFHDPGYGNFSASVYVKGKNDSKYFTVSNFYIE